MELKSYVRLTIFLFVMFYFLKSIFWGTSGLFEYLKFNSLVNKDKEKIVSLNKSIDKINRKIALWKNDEFVVEKKARKNLQMGFENETVYLIN